MLNCYFNIETIRDRFAPQQERWFLDYVDRSKMYDPICKRIIQDIDNSKLVEFGVIESPVLGCIGMNELSGGVKTLLLLYTCPDKIFRSGYMGDNCAAMLKEVSSLVDCHLLLEHPFLFLQDQKIYFPQYDVYTNSAEELRAVKVAHWDDYIAEGPDLLRKV